ncbi:MAG: DinB family protein [Chitinophagaceae bacterium]|nr:DinB family protein [Chitinophagaceae bacterium]
MKYDIERSVEILERTPDVLYELLNGLDEQWLMNNEGPETFSPYDVVGHLVHGEKTDWRPRIQRILEVGTSKSFELFDRFAMYEVSRGKTISQLLQEFKTLRVENIIWFSSLQLNEIDLQKKGMHPKLGKVTLSNLLATWVAHDLTHIGQITRVMAKQYKEAMGPWPEFFRILTF